MYNWLYYLIWISDTTKLHLKLHAIKVLCLETLEGRLENDRHLQQGFISGKFEMKNKNRKKQFIFK